ncbi:MAG: hypothetical protein R2754_12290 [Microthrixaceae bacterium]
MLIAASCTGSDDTVREAEPASEVTTEGITGNVRIRTTDFDHPVTGEAVNPIGDVIEITSDGTVEAAATVTVETGEPIEQDEIVVGVTARSEEGSWEPLEVTVAGTKVVASIEHLSLFSFFRFPDPTDLVGELFNDITSDLFAAATPPTCEDEDGARADGHEASSEGPDVLIWCLGRDGTGRYLRVVNNRRYPVILSSALSVREAAEPRALGDRLAEALGGDRIALPPRSQVTYAVELESGDDASVSAEFDGLAYSLFQLQFGAELAGAFLTRFGTGAPPPGSLAALLASAGCVDALIAGAPGRLLTSCLDYDGLSELFGSPAAAIATPIILTAGVLSYFDTAAASLWDEVAGRDRYTIAVSHTAPEPEEAVLLHNDGVGALKFNSTASEGDVVDPLVAQLGRFDEDSGWEESPCLPGEGIDERTLEWGSLTVYLERSRGAVSVTGWMARGEPPAGAKLGSVNTPGTPWATASAAGAQWSPDYGVWETPDGYRGELSVEPSSVEPPEDARIASVSAGFAYLLGC